MRKITDLQALIERRATKRLDKDLRDLSHSVGGNRLLRHNELTPPIQQRVDDKWIVRSMEQLLYFEGSYMKTLREKWLPTYIEEESATFLQEVDSLKSRVDELFDNQQNQ